VLNLFLLYIRGQVYTPIHVSDLRQLCHFNVQLEFHGTSFPRSVLVTSSRGSLPGWHEDVRRKTVPWNLSFTQPMIPHISMSHFLFNGWANLLAARRQASTVSAAAWVCLSVCPSVTSRYILYRNGSTYKAYFWHTGNPALILHCVLQKFGYPDTDNFFPVLCTHKTIDLEICPNSIGSISCGFVAELIVQKIQRSKSTTNGTSGAGPDLAGGGGPGAQLTWGH